MPDDTPTPPDSSLPPFAAGLTDNIFVAAALLAAAAYDSTPEAAVGQGVQPLGADDLNIPATGDIAGGSYEFANGVYTQTDDDNSAVAHVYVAELDGVTTLALAFRGTDEPGDILDHQTFTDHYAKFAPLIAGIENYIADPANGIDRVLVTGHSLGSAMVTTAMVQEGWVNDPRFLGVGIGAHGTDASLAAQAPQPVTNLVNFIHTHDVLALDPDPENLSFVSLGELLENVSELTSEDSFEPKARPGIDVWIDTGQVENIEQSGIDSLDSFIDAEHGLGRYATDIASLADQNALDLNTVLAGPPSQFFAVGTDAADDFDQRRDEPDALPEVEFFPARDFAQSFFTGAGDDVIAGLGGNDDIDGGAGTDVAIYRGAAADYTAQTTGGVTTITPSAGSPGAADGTDTLVNVEILRFADGDQAITDLVTLAGVASATDTSGLIG